MSDSPATPWTAARPASLSVGFPRQESWSGLPFPLQAQQMQIENAGFIFTSVLFCWKLSDNYISSQDTKYHKAGVDLFRNFYYSRQKKSLSSILAATKFYLFHKNLNQRGKKREEIFPMKSDSVSVNTSVVSATHGGARTTPWGCEGLPLPSPGDLPSQRGNSLLTQS